MEFNKWRIGLTEGGLAWFLSLGLPPPNTAPYTEFVEVVNYALGKQATIGNPSIPVGFNDLSGSQMARLRKYVDDARANNVHILYMTVIKNIGIEGGVHWVDVRGYVTPMSFTPITPVARGAMYQNVEFTLNNLEVINDPAIFS